MAQAIARFDHFAHARQRPAWSYPLFVACAGFAALLLFAMWAKSIWTTEQLERPKERIDLAIAPSPPPPPPPLAGGEKPRDIPVIVPKRTVETVVQPVREEKPIERPSSEQIGEKDGEQDGEQDGVKDGVKDGVLDSPTKPTPLPTAPIVIPKTPRIVPPSALAASRTAGNPQIEPDDVTKTEIARSGKDMLRGTFKLCLSEAGAITSVTMLKSTGFSAYDAKIESTIRSTWRYRPFLVDNQPAAVCTGVRFEYSQR